MSLSSVFEKMPMDIVYRVLSYDRRFVISNGTIITILPLDKVKYKKIRWLLNLKPPIRIYSGAMVWRATVRCSTQTGKIANYSIPMIREYELEYTNANGHYGINEPWDATKVWFKYSINHLPILKIQLP